MCRLPTRLPVLILALAVLATCRADDGAIARVGSHPVRLDAFQSYLEAITGEAWQQVDDRVASRLLDQYLDQEVILATTGGATAPAAPSRRAVVVRHRLADACGQPPAADATAVAAEVERRSKVVRPAGAHVRQLLLDTREAAVEARRQLAAGEDWTALSKQVSRAPNADGGGEVGWVRRGGLPETLEDAIFALAPGEISQPVQGPSGFHIFQVSETRPEGGAVRAELEAEVRRELDESAARAFTSTCIDRLAREVGVTTRPGRLWFQYDGRYAEGRHAG